MGCASLPKRALKASATCPAGTGGIDAVDAGGALGVGAGGAGGRLLGPKMSVRVDGDGEMSPVDGIAENNEFCAGAWACADSGSAATRTRINPSSGQSRPHTAAIADSLPITAMFSAQIAAISSRPVACL